MRKRTGFGRRSGRVRTVAAVLVAFLLTITTLPVLAGLGYSDERIREDTPVLHALTGILERLDAALEQLQDVELPRLEEQIEGILVLLEELASELGAVPESGEDKPPIKGQLIKLDLMLHRLVFMLEKVVERVDETPKRLSEREKAKIEELKLWIDGYIAGETRRMDRIEARKFERMAKAMLGEVGKQLKRMADRASEHQPEKARLKIVVERIETLLAQLDRFIIRSVGKSPKERPQRSNP